MHEPPALYRPSLALLTDLYQLTMACGYWKSGIQDREAVFHLVFRDNPCRGGFSVAAGLGYVIELLKAFQFQAQDLEYLATLKGNDDRALFDESFLDHLSKMTFACEIDAVPEGTMVFPHEPLVRVKGPLMQCQILETPLLNAINFQSLIATRAARLTIATKGDPILEFGLRRAQGIDGALAASRAAYIGGGSATSNVLAGRLFDIPVRGTHAHSWVMAFGDELASFQAYAEAMPNNCVFLVDTYDTLQGIRHAIEVGRWLRDNGHEMVGIRLDSGDLAYLSIEARKMLDNAGFVDAQIIASNDLDEYTIASLKQQGATVGIWGVGTRLATSYDQPAMGGVYKLSAIREPDKDWQHKIKLSEQKIKISNPGILQVRRFSSNGKFIADAIYDETIGIDDEVTIIDPMDMTRRKEIAANTHYEDLLQPIFRDGQCIYRQPSIHDMRERTFSQMANLHEGIKRFMNPHQYPVGLEYELNRLKTELLLQARGITA